MALLPILALLPLAAGNLVRSAARHEHVSIDAEGWVKANLMQQAAEVQRHLKIAREMKSGDCAAALRSMMAELRTQGVLAPMDGEPGQHNEGGSNNAEVNYLAELAKNEIARLNKPVGNAMICQTGFNFGNSAFAFMCGTSAKVTSWDLGEHDYVKPAEAMIQKLFPGRHSLRLGDSTQTLPKSDDMTGRCDVVFVDGGHTKDVAKADIENFARLAAPGALLIVDDCNNKEVRDKTAGDKSVPWYVMGVNTAFTSAASAGMLDEDAEKEAGLQDITKARSVCVARYRKPTSTLGKLLR